MRERERNSCFSGKAWIVRLNERAVSSRGEMEMNFNLSETKDSFSETSKLHTKIILRSVLRQIFIREFTYFTVYTVEISGGFHFHREGLLLSFFTPISHFHFTKPVNEINETWLKWRDGIMANRKGIWKVWNFHFCQEIAREVCCVFCFVSSSSLAFHPDQRNGFVKYFLLNSSRI